MNEFDYLGLYFYFLVDEEINSFFEFLDNIKSDVGSKSKKIKEDWDKAIEAIGDGCNSDANDHYSGKAEELDSYEQLLFKSFIIVLHSFIENYIFIVCNEIYRGKKPTFRHTDLKDSGILAGVRYINKVLNKNFPRKNEIKDDLNIIRYVRNCLVHANGSIEGFNNGNKIKEFSLKNPTLLTLSNNRISVNFGFLKFIMSTNNELVTEIRDHIVNLVK